MSPTLALVLVLLVVLIWCRSSGSKKEGMPKTDFWRTSSLFPKKEPKLKPGSALKFKHTIMNLAESMAAEKPRSPDEKQLYQEALQKLVFSWNTSQKDYPVSGESLRDTRTLWNVNNAIEKAANSTALR
jgi:hypothetical protein